jgi:glycosyltransferase involved in cell wall biosynthesis
LQKILFLYTELAEYFLACVQELEKTGHQVIVIHWPVNPEAPFQFRKLETTKFRNREELRGKQLEQLIEKIDPTIILCSGWVDREYLRICKKYQPRIPVVLLLDNHWKGTVRQYLATMISGFMLRSRFSHVWVPGKPQHLFASKLGFPEKNIREGYYSADTQLFRQYYIQFRKEKSESFPHRLLYIGRYTHFKGIRDLWEVFSEIHDEFPDWELWCTGTGDLWEERSQAPGIRHFGFVQPSVMGDIIRQAGIFILPSHVEPWGVVVHEMAAAGFPLLCSDSIGATSTFLEPGTNGLSFTASNRDDLKKQMKSLMSLSDNRLVEMGDLSHQLSSKLSPQNWVKTLLGFTDPND